MSITDGFKTIFKDTARHHHRFEVFRDFVLMSALAIENSFLKSDDVEAEYMAIVRRYEREDAIKMGELLGEVVNGLEAGMTDFLGSVFMELDLGSNEMGQFFTPFHVSQLMAQLNYSGVLSEGLPADGFIRLSEPCCGSAGMVIAFAEAMATAGLNPQQQLWVSCIDIDRVAASMAYIQLSLLGIPGEVNVGNTLSLSISRTMKTPMHFVMGWESKLAERDALDLASRLVSDSNSVGSGMMQVDLF